MDSGIGAALSSKPQLVSDMVAQVHSRVALPVTIKIRICDDLRQTVELVKRAEHAGVSWITVHGRTAKQRCEPVNLDAIKLVSEAKRGEAKRRDERTNQCDVTSIHVSFSKH
jgi:tRNA-dihydrouridine synthase 4